MGLDPVSLPQSSDWLADAVYDEISPRRSAIRTATALVTSLHAAGFGFGVSGVGS
jgi:hypothetical protein